MKPPTTVAELELALESTSAKVLFGPDPAKVFKALALICHPDRNPGDKRAEAVFKKLAAMHDSLAAPKVVVKSKKHSYTVDGLLAIGDVADLHLASADDKDYILKVSRIPGGDHLLEAERDALVAILTKAGDTHYRKFFPTLVESFPARGKVQKRVNVFLKEGQLHSAEQVLAKYPDGVSGRHVGWMFKRMLTAIGFAHKAGWVHGSVTPSHVLFDVANHGVVLVGFGQAVKVGEPIKVVSTKYRDWSPSEVIAKKAAIPATDVYQAAKLASVLAKDLPKVMARFLNACQLPGPKMRPDDAWVLHDEWDEILRGVYGAPKFVELSMV